MKRTWHLDVFVEGVPVPLPLSFESEANGLAVMTDIAKRVTSRDPPDGPWKGDGGEYLSFRLSDLKAMSLWEEL